MDNSEQLEWITEAMRQHEASLVRYAYGFTGSLDQARDVVQDTFIKLCRMTPEDFQHSMKAWLYRVCRNGALEVLRKEGRMTELDEITILHHPEKSPSPDKVSETKDQFNMALKLIDKLPVKQQEVIRLKYNHQMSYREISEVSGLSESNVGFLLHTGLQSLRKQMLQLQEVMA